MGFDRRDVEGRRMTAEQFEALLIEVRNGASYGMSALLDEVRGGESHEQLIEDARAVWHASEVALGILFLGRYFPKREAVADMRELLRLLDDDEDD
jgi:hypothetical protein